MKKIFAVGIIMTFMLAINVQAEQPTDRLPGLATGEKAPDFELTTLDNKIVKLSDYRGKKVMLNFWATWCPPCKEEMPAMERFYKDDGEQIQLLAVNIDTINDIKGFAQKMKITFPILLDKKGEVAKSYQVLAIPTTYFINEEGIIYEKYLGAMSIETMRKLAFDL